LEKATGLGQQLSVELQNQLEEKVSTLTAENKLLKEKLSAVSPGLKQAAAWAEEAVKAQEASEAVQEVGHAS
jgi:hypothetical protein